MKRFCFYLALSLLCNLAACGGSSSDNEDTSFTGVWDVTYNIVRTAGVNSCDWYTSSDVSGFLDIQEINESDVGYDLYSSNGMIDGSAALDPDGVLQVENVTAGDLFGDSTYCVWTSSITYQPVHNNRAENYFHQVITCSDGYKCEERAVGNAVRRIN